MSNTNVSPKNQERPFQIAELFFSTTDLKGVILSGNEVFRRVSGYSEEELLGQPHSIIRHPDMPRCVFALLWQYILAGKTIAAYVKNMANDGCYYWVIALVIPLEGRFLSIRFKPSSKLLPIVRQVYGDILNMEKQLEAGGMKRQEMIAQTAGALMEKLGSLGFSDYDSFMHAFLAEELRSREQTIAVDRTETKNSSTGATPAEQTGASVSLEAQLSALLESCRSTREYLTREFLEIDTYTQIREKLAEKSSHLLDLCKTTRLLSMNAQIESSRLAEAGDALGIVAHRMGENSQETAATIVQVNESIAGVVTLLRQIVFGLSTAKLEAEMLTNFVEERVGHQRSGAPDERELSNFHALLEALGRGWKVVSPLFRSIDLPVRQAHLHLQELGRFRQMLEFIHSVGQVEAARTLEGNKFAVILQEVRQHIARTQDEINAFQQALQALGFNIERSRSSQSSITGGLVKLNDHLGALCVA